MKHIAVSNQNHVCLPIPPPRPRTRPLPHTHTHTAPRPHFPSVPFRLSPQSPPTSLFLQYPSVFVFRARALCTGNCIHWEHSGKPSAAFPLALTLATWKKKKKTERARERWMKGFSNSQTPRPGQKQKSAVLLPSLHFPPLFHSLGV